MTPHAQLRPVDKQLAGGGVMRFLVSANCARIVTTRAGGRPYNCPLLFVVLDGSVRFHNTAAQEHLRPNIEHDAGA